MSVLRRLTGVWTILAAAVFVATAPAWVLAAGAAILGALFYDDLEHE